jgi:hypothetical protein
METPCPRCGTLKTESVRHGFLYNTLWKMGYHLRRCSFCDRRRLLKRGDRNRPHPNDLTAEELTEHFNRKIASAIRRDAGPAVVVKSMALDAALPSPAPALSTGSTSVAVAEVGAVEGLATCPSCGNTKYRRSRRKWYERWLNRPRMARCLKCAHRYPYPD